jgi:hypothetical protein
VRQTGEGRAPQFHTHVEKPHLNTEYSTTRLMCEVNSNTQILQKCAAGIVLSDRKDSLKTRLSAAPCTHNTHIPHADCTHHYTVKPHMVHPISRGSPQIVLHLAANKPTAEETTQRTANVDTNPDNSWGYNYNNTRVASCPAKCTTTCAAPYCQQQQNNHRERPRTFFSVRE